MNYKYKAPAERQNLSNLYAAPLELFGMCEIEFYYKYSAPLEQLSK